MPSEKAIARQAQYEAAKAERLANPKPKIERHWVRIDEVPSHVEADDARLALQYLLKHADYVEMMAYPKDQSQYKAHFDDGVYKGEFVFTWTENGLTPLLVYEKLQRTGWPGFSMSWVKEAARQEMKQSLQATNRR